MSRTIRPKPPIDPLAVQVRLDVKQCQELTDYAYLHEQEKRTKALAMISAVEFTITLYYNQVLRVLLKPDATHVVAALEPIGKMAVELAKLLSHETLPIEVLAQVIDTNFMNQKLRSELEELAYQLQTKIDQLKKEKSTGAHNKRKKNILINARHDFELLYDNHAIRVSDEKQQAEFKSDFVDACMDRIR